MPRRKTVRRPVVQVSKKKSKKTSVSDEIGFIGKALRGLGALGGSTLGGLVGAPAAGSAVGSGLGAAVSKWLGAGDYSVDRNSLVQRASANIPMMHNTNQSIIVRHREFVGTISGSTGFTVQKSITLNPGLIASFPWLARIAQRFQEYEFKGLIFHYVPTSGTFNGTSAALGSVMLQTTYRSTDTAPASKVEMLNEYCSNETVPFETMAHPIECDPRENPFAVHYIRTGTTGVSDPLLYDIGTTFVATQGMSNTDVVGDLWCTYEIELKKPLISSPVVTESGYYGATYALPTKTAFFDGAIGPLVGNMPITASGRTITLPARAGTYVVVVALRADGVTDLATVGWTTTSSTKVNCTSWPFAGYTDGFSSLCTGTNPNTNLVLWMEGYVLTDPTIPATVTLPTAVWTSGTTIQTVLTVMSLGT